MAYEKQTWEDGVSPVNAERLNHIEEGVAQAANSGGGGGTVYVQYYTSRNEFRMNMTFAEMDAAYKAGKNVLLFNADDNPLLHCTGYYENAEIPNPSNGETYTVNYYAFAGMGVNWNGKLVSINAALVSDEGLGNQLQINYYTLTPVS